MAHCFELLKKSLVLAAFAALPQFVAAQDSDYTCRADNAEISPGVCLPEVGEIVQSQAIRATLYTRCNVLMKGDDEYTGNCCEHLTEFDERTLSVCPAGRSFPAKGLSRIIADQEINDADAAICDLVDCDAIMSYVTSED